MEQRGNNRQEQRATSSRDCACLQVFRVGASVCVCVAASLIVSLGLLVANLVAQQRPPTPPWEEHDTTSNKVGSKCKQTCRGLSMTQRHKFAYSKQTNRH